MTDLDRETVGRMVLPVLEDLLTLVETLDNAVTLPADVRQQYEHDRRALRDKITQAQVYFAPVQREE